MRRYRAHRGGLIATLLGVLAAWPVVATTPLIDATIDPAKINVGDSARLTISTVGNGIQSVTLPVVPGLEFRVIERARGVRDVHGASLPTLITVVLVTARVAGTFIIPAMTPKSQPLVLRVGPAADSGPPVGNRPGGVGSGGVGAGGGIHMTQDGSAYLRLIGLTGEAYVGQSIPIAIELGIRAGVVKSINGLPTLSGGDFTLDNLSRQPERVEKLIDGQQFILFTWHSVLAAIKPGKFSFSVATPLTINVSTRSPQEARFEDQLGDPFMQRVYGATVPKDINVASPDYELLVLALPEEGRPADFGGAVGTFTIASDLSTLAPVAGDPLTLRMRVAGAGNFDRVDSPMLDRVERWKTYPPKSSFKASDAIGYKGEKTFEQPLIASKPGAQTLPGLAFSYFNPATRRYETARSAPLDVMVAASAADTAAADKAAADTVSAGTFAAAAAGALRPDHAAADASMRSLVPLYLQPRFLVLPSLLGLVFAGGWVALRRGAAQRGEELSRRAPRLSRAAKRSLAQLEAAARRGDTELFFATARAALGGASDDQTADIRQLWLLADEIKFSGADPVAVDFARWTEVVRRALLSPRPG